MELTADIVAGFSQATMASTLAATAIGALLRAIRRRLPRCFR